MFEVTVEETFAAGHALRNYHGKCENVHGHNYKVQVTFEGAQLDSIGLLVDFVDVKQKMHAVVERLDHQFLNELAPFDQLNPSAENMAKYFYDELSKELKRENSVRVERVKIWETDTCSATYRSSLEETGTRQRP
ncbi:MAG TPA: 6-carboxytetrahydropterin synthase QueD [Bryobacteraceae bacterium]|jgi:6-pyruvoyltetrahydropterin/6-carboxytetrahydropterin synthase|nr:6-carboxytetrahydropterin synthase QueD [Bryobacteraceae bacterium]